MAIINNQTFPFSRWWFSSAIDLVVTNPSCFSKKNIAHTMAVLIAGSKVVIAIKEWLISATIIEPGPKQTYKLTNFGVAIRNNDPQLNNSGTWWAIHLALSFSSKGETYSLYFIEVAQSKSLGIESKELLESLQNQLKDSYAEASVEKSFQGVNKLFDKNSPLDDLGLITKGGRIKLGNPDLTHDIILHALFLVKFIAFPSRESISFSKLCESSHLHHFLCLSLHKLRDSLVEMSQSKEYGKYFNFSIAIDIESLTFSDEITPAHTILRLIQSKEETWK